MTVGLCDCCSCVRYLEVSVFFLVSSDSDHDSDTTNEEEEGMVEYIVVVEVEEIP